MQENVSFPNGSGFSSKLEQVKSRLKPYIVDYISRFRPELKDGRMCHCINPAHPDNNPSCSVNHNDRHFFHCFGCGASGDIFTAAHFLEGKPVSGPGFLLENVKYLAEMYGVEMPEIRLSEDERYDLDVYRAYMAAAEWVARMPKLAARAAAEGKKLRMERVLEKVRSYGWAPELMERLQVGYVGSYEAYRKRMIEVSGFEESFLEEIGLLDRRIFSADSLIFTVRDEHGRPVGFAARNCAYEEQKARGEKVSKFYNTAAGPIGGRRGNQIYQKSRRLFGLDVAKQHAPPLYIFEGYADAVTAMNAGIRNVCAIGSTSFSQQHLDVLLNMNGRGRGIRHLVFVLDADAAGENGTSRFVQMISSVVGNRPGLQVEIISLPEGSDDPDAFIRRHGAEAFLSLPRQSLFEWQLAHELKSGAADEDAVIERVIGSIVNEPSPMKRYNLARDLAAASGRPVEVILGEIEHRVDAGAAQIRSETILLGQRVAAQLAKEPAKATEIIQTAIREAERLEQARGMRTVNDLMKYYASVIEEAEQDRDSLELKTGWPEFDRLFGGIPRSDAFISMPGKPNQGKSSVVANLAWRLVEHNPDALIVVHSVDDNLRRWLPRLFGSKTGVYSQWFFKSGYWLEKNPKVSTEDYGSIRFADLYQEMLAWMEKHIREERLLLYDICVLDATVSALQELCSRLRKQHPERPIVMFCDNFHLYRGSASREESDQQHVRALSAAFKELTTRHRLTLVATMELPKAALEPGRRPRLANIKGSAGIAYDSSANIGIYNDLKDMRAQAVLRREVPVEGWQLSCGVHQATEVRPVLEFVFDKSKVNNGFDGSLYFDFDPMSGRVSECADQEHWKEVAEAQIAELERRAPRKRPETETSAVKAASVSAASA